MSDRSIPPDQWGPIATAARLAQVFPRHVRGVPVIEFGHGAVKIFQYVGSNSRPGLSFCLAPTPGQVGERAPHQPMAIDDLPGLFACFEFASAESVDVLIEELEAVRQLLIENESMTTEGKP